MKFSIRLLYLYLFSFIGLLIGVIGCIRLVDLGLKVYVFDNADTYTYTTPLFTPEGKPASPSPELERQMQVQQSEEATQQRKRTTAEALSMILVGAPLYLYHWSLIKKESKK
jgi:hypothetical protein